MEAKRLAIWTWHLLPAVTLMALAWGASAEAQGFTCRPGTNPSCLSYGETICSSTGQCVDASSTCFSRYECNSEGFTCMSNLTECGADFDRLVAEHEELIDTHNALVDDFNELADDARDLRDASDDMASCLTFAGTLAEAQACAY